MCLSRSIPILMFILTGITAGFTQSSDYVRISLTMQDFDVTKSWMGVDHYHQKDGMVIVEVSVNELDKLEGSGIPYEVLVKDLTAYYQEQNQRFRLRSATTQCTEPDHVAPRNFKLG